ncbi:MAG TPA: cysteine--tRNA ligase [Rhizomicrobium sp.]|nr:cysteine--tRNA ligase [Rhizomicrobium sp.]
MTKLRLYNTLSRTKEDFAPLDRNNVRMYVCGPTVYDFAHIGNARPAIVFDVLFRLLRHIYGPGRVTYVRNITDIDDKINARAQERAKGRNAPILGELRALTEETYGIYRQDVAALNCLEPSIMPRATENVPQMIAMTERLIAEGYAYAAEGHVLFRVGKKADYGKLARRSTDDMLAGARVDVAPYKEDPMDFVLWKPSDDATPGWPSPWGRGRPGWHLECSAMIEATMGETIDIHGGGIDLVFPHHENEIAQSEAAHRGHPLARYWLHNGFLNVEGEKMSKSLGNFVTIHELLKDWPGEVLRFNMLRTHYRQPMDWTVAGMKESWNTLENWYAVTEPLADPPLGRAFLEALCDDLNTPQAIAELHKGGDHELAGGLGLLGFSNVQERIAARPPVDPKDIADAIAARAAARKAKNFAESDRIRDALLTKGIVLKDGPSGTTWEMKR